MNDMAHGVAIRRATDADIGFIMATERTPGYEDFVGRWEHAAHAAAMADADNAYLIGLDGAAPRGFAIVMHLADANQNLYLKRIAVNDPGRSFGGRFLDRVLDWAFRETSAHRFWLNHIDGNARARGVYERAGFIDEGAARESVLRPGGARLDMRRMSILRPEWEARRAKTKGTA